ncbi:MAG: glycosyltransferase family 2 protein, partial [Chroococcidiopsidaceae cyanobacterium CP_BM_RX_35]|nr:glycosyltransferase family 2 protein [Chroococcidiopsidaceae cyanobacterium CP_BM_RX_35]
KRSTFLNLGGFNACCYQRPSIEDIELGYRIRQAGGKIHLAKQVQIKHHKDWKLTSLIKTDVLDRGIPWTKLLLSNKSGFIDDLNLQVSSRISVGATYILGILILMSFYSIEITVLTVPVLILLLSLNFHVYHFFYVKRGLFFTIRVIPMHWFYYLYSGAAFILGAWQYWQEQLRIRSDISKKHLIPD